SPKSVRQRLAPRAGHPRRPGALQTCSAPLQCPRSSAQRSLEGRCWSVAMEAAAKEGQPQEQELWLARSLLLHYARGDCSAVCENTAATWSQRRSTSSLLSQRITACKTWTFAEQTKREPTVT